MEKKINKLSPVWGNKIPKRIDELPKEKINVKRELENLKPKTETGKQKYGFGGNE